MNEFNLAVFLWLAAGPLAGAFLGAYFKRGAEDFATNANFENVLARTDDRVRDINYKLTTEN